jgi:hypothetical protein
MLIILNADDAKSTSTSIGKRKAGRVTYSGNYIIADGEIQGLWEKGKNVNQVGTVW